ncbi:MAG: DNA polymerase I [Candidatus Omnitrophica bacterium]|nr:DNA polymerase I [Candidatus Omnitrophota bacterium]
MQKKLFLIDGNSFAYRAFYAIRSLTASDGRPTNAVYGVITMINKILKEEKPDLFAVAFDLKGPTFRHKKYADYKAHRKPMPDDLVSQMPVIKKVIEGYRIPIFEKEGYEADDILATIAVQASNKGIATYIVTGDKDALQIVNDRIKVYNAQQKDVVVYDEDMVKAKYGVAPAQMTDLLAIMGDSSDNVTGVRGIGEKGARELIREFGSVEKLLDNLDRVKSAAKQKLLREHVDEMRLSKELVTVDTGVPLDVSFEDMAVKEPDAERLMILFKDLGFTSLLKQYTPRESLGGTYYLVDTEAKLDRLIHDLKDQGEWAFDFETTSENPMDAEPVGVSFSYKDKEAWYVPFNLSKKLSAKIVLSRLKEVFEDPKIRKVGQNIKYEYIVLNRAGIELKGMRFDTMVASYCLNPSKLNHNLSSMALEALNHRMTEIDELIGKGKTAITMDKVDVDKVMRYCCEDSDVTLKLKKIFEKELRDKELFELFDGIEMPLVEVLASMEIAGVSIDTAYLGKLSREMAARVEKMREEIYKLAGEEFNINSPKQLQAVLFEKKEMPVIKRTKTGPSTDEEVLTNLAEKYELPARILAYREIAKLKSTYVDNLPALVNATTGKIHTSFNQTVTQTGRLSSSDPNLQNIPIKTEEGKKIRKAFVPEHEGHLLVSADYSQIELRILAHLSGDENLVRAFTEDRDVHKYTASLIWGVPESQVTDEMRANAKTVNFGIIYGMSHYRLGRDLGMPVDEAKAFIDNYFTRYAGVKVYLEDRLRDCRKRKFVTTIMQRRRYIPDILSDNVRVRSFAERTAINAPLQGSAADIIKVAMIGIHKKLKGFKSRMIIQVHDELVFDVAGSELLKVAAIVKEGMENAVKLNVPLKVSIEAGKNWLDQEEVSL